MFIARRRDSDPAKPQQFSFDKKDRRVTVYYFYLWDADFGPAFIKVCTYCPWPIKVWVNGHEWAKLLSYPSWYLGFTELSNGFADTDDPERITSDLRSARTGRDQRVLPTLAGSAAAAAHCRRRPRRLLVGVVDGPSRGVPHSWCSPSPATLAASSRRWSFTTSTSAARTPSRSSSTARSAAAGVPPAASSRPRSSPAAPRSPSTPSTSTPASSSTSKTAVPCGSRP